jgi:hypothetical protein
MRLHCFYTYIKSHGRGTPLYRLTYGFMSLKLMRLCGVELSVLRNYFSFNKHYKNWRQSEG